MKWNEMKCRTVQFRVGLLSVHNGGMHEYGRKTEINVKTLE